MLQFLNLWQKEQECVDQVYSHTHTRRHTDLLSFFRFPSTLQNVSFNFSIFHAHFQPSIAKEENHIHTLYIPSLIHTYKYTQLPTHTHFRNKVSLSKTLWLKSLSALPRLKRKRCQRRAASTLKLREECLWRAPGPYSGWWAERPQSKHENRTTEFIKQL